MRIPKQNAHFAYAFRTEAIRSAAYLSGARELAHGPVALGALLVTARSEIEAAEALFTGGGQVERLLRTKDWSATPLGPVSEWPEVLRAMVRTTLDSGYPMAVWWGRELFQIYNEHWRQWLGTRKHPQALVGRAEQTWPELWSFVGPMVEHVWLRGEATGTENMPMLIDRNGLLEEVFATFTYSPITDAGGTVVGIHNTALETTSTMVAERRMRALRAVAAATSGAETPQRACQLVAEALASDRADVPFALLYLLERPRREAQLAGAAGLEAGSFAAAHVIDVTHSAGSVWPLARLFGEAADDPSGDQAGMLVEGLDERLNAVLPPPPTPLGALPPRSAFVVRLPTGAGAGLTGVLLVGLNPHRPFDDGYRGFLDLLAGQIAGALSQAHARRRERQQLEKLRELDRAKTEFFSNVSHEFCTPLALMLAPLEEMLRHPEEPISSQAAEVELVQRNARRLLRLVGTLLDFSQAEAGRLRAMLVPTDLAALTADVASMFRSAAEVAGLELTIDAPPLPEPVWVDPEMWEKIVSNLLSNALKFTWIGSINVTLRALHRHAELTVHDTGVGIPAEDLPHVFERFHRVRDARGRTHEGAGIGLALVDELVRRHYGRTRITSQPDTGTTLNVWVPLAHPPNGEPGTPPTNSRGEVAAALAEEAALWDTHRDHHHIDLADPDTSASHAVPAGAADVCVLVADDNPDMRDYLVRLLSPAWTIIAANDGQQALDIARQHRPDLVLADVMMPGLGGFALLNAIRADEGLASTPVVLVTARAGEEDAIKGLLAGANDYIVKPFSARELIARVTAQLELSRARRRPERDRRSCSTSDAQ